MFEASTSSQFRPKGPAVCVGLDQTGAVIRAGAGWKPLPAAVAVRTGRRIELLATGPSGRGGEPGGLSLSALNRDALLGLPGVGAAQGAGQLRVLVDAVLGLPVDITTQIQKPGASLTGWFEQACAHHESRLRQGMLARGRDPAEDFFATLLKRAGASGVPTRECERLAGANSVFVPRPCQKNVQTGTYRIWVELGAAIRSGERFRFPHHGDSPREGLEGDSPAPGISLEESWPSLLWKRLLQASHREPGNLRVLLQTLGKREGLDITITEPCMQYCARHPDHADALVLALAGVILPENSGENPIAGEGWITGLARP